MGGVAGHLMHLYDNRDLSYNDIADILSKASQGELVGTEKTDGFNIYLGFKDGEARAARNKGDMRRGGMNAAALAARKYKGGPQVRQIYVDSFRAFEKAMLSLSEEERAKLFGPDGEIFYNTEILGMLQPEEPEDEPRPANVIKYDPSMITIHPAGHKRYNPETNSLEVVDVSQNAKVLDAAVDRFTEALAGEDFQLARTAVAQLNKLDNDHDLNIALSRIQKSGLTGDMTINDLLTDRVSQVVNERFSVLAEEKRQAIVARVLKLEGYPSLTVIKKGLPKDIANEVSKFIKEDSIIPIRKVIAPIEGAIHDLSVELLRGLQSAYILDNEAEVERLQAEVATAIKKIKEYAGEGSEMAHEMLYRQLLKLKHHDEVDTAVEGFVFQHDGNLYKFTGNFAPVNQLIGLFKYGRGSVPAIRDPEDDELNEQASQQILRKIAVVPGKFKPPHRQHLEMVEHYSEEVGPDGLVLIMISPLPQETNEKKIPITRDDSKRIWELYLDNAGLSNVAILDTPFESPVKTAYELPKGNVPSFIPRPGDLIIPGASDKPCPRTDLPDWHRFKRFAQMPDVLPGVVLDDAEGTHYAACAEPLHGRNFKAALENPEMPLDRWLPGGVNGDDIVNLIAGMREVGSDKTKITTENIFKMIEEIIEDKKTKPVKKNKKKKEPITLENLFDMVEEVIDEEETVEEDASAMAGGAVAGAAGGLDPGKRDPWKSGKKKRRKGRRIYIPD
jgi:hypothetical protein